MQRINFHRPAKTEATELSLARFAVVSIGAIFLAVVMLAWNLIETNTLQGQLSAVQSERAAAEAEYKALNARPLPDTDLSLTAELARMEARHDYWLSVLDLLRNSDTVSMARLDEVLVALDNADSGDVWLENISVQYSGAPTGKLQGRAIHSDASAIYLRKLEEQLKQAGLTVTHMLVTVGDAEPLKFEATLKQVSLQK